MGIEEKTALALLGLFLAGTVIRVFRTPLRLVGRVAVNTLLGFGALLLLNLTGSITGVMLGVNLVNALVIGILGVPGLGLLLLVQWLFAL